MSAGIMKSGRQIGNGQPNRTRVASPLDLAHDDGSTTLRHVDERRGPIDREVWRFLPGSKPVRIHVPAATEQVFERNRDLLHAAGDRELQHRVDALAVIGRELLSGSVIYRENRSEL